MRHRRICNLWIKWESQTWESTDYQYIMPKVSSKAWNEFIAGKPDAHLLQLGAWGELKSSFGWHAERVVAGDAGAQILFRKLPLGYTIAYIPKGPVGDRWEALWLEIDAMCQERNSVFLKVEMDEWEDDNREELPEKFIPSEHSIQPPRTIMVSLEGSEEEALARMKQKTRYNIRLAGKKDVVVRPSSDVAAFSEMSRITAERDGFGVHSLEYYQRAYDLFHQIGACEMLVAEFEGVPLAALMVFAHGKRAWYVYGASNNQERNRMPTYLLQWEAMRWAREKGCTEYDLWGVPDEDVETLEAEFMNRSDELWGVYRFKRGFGGEVRRAVGAMDRVYKLGIYQLYQMYMRVRG